MVGDMQAIAATIEPLLMAAKGIAATGKVAVILPVPLNELPDIVLALTCIICKGTRLS